MSKDVSSPGRDFHSCPASADPQMGGGTQPPGSEPPEPRTAVGAAPSLVDPEAPRQQGNTGTVDGPPADRPSLQGATHHAVEGSTAVLAASLDPPASDPGGSERILTEPGPRWRPRDVRSCRAGPKPKRSKRTAVGVSPVWRPTFISRRGRPSPGRGGMELGCLLECYVSHVLTGRSSDGVVRDGLQTSHVSLDAMACACDRGTDRR